MSNAALGGPLDPLTTYYWKVDGVNAEPNTVPGSVWSFTTEASEANNPRPADGATYVLPLDSLTLEWDGFG